MNLLSSSAIISFDLGLTSRSELFDKRSLRDGSGVDSRAFRDTRWRIADNSRSISV
jgi:hypothetical protein